MMERAYGCQNMSPGVIINPRHIRPSRSKASSVVAHLFLGRKTLSSHEDNWRKSQGRFGKLSHYLGSLKRAIGKSTRKVESALRYVIGDRSDLPCARG